MHLGPILIGTSGWTYRDPRAYAGSYSRARLEAWAVAIRALAPQVGATFVYFNNDQKAYAPRNAATLRALLGV